ncbi:MAG: RNA polymerase sigma factor [Bacteroidales bacterium]|nr:RNA polymerase sigma factor [Bacteroidales bacterium]MCF8352780.1 RNA polymerase sigma factor [Bacteroidales bacterium]
MTVEDYNKTIDLYADNLYRFILKNSRNEELANDVVQETFEKLWMKIENVDSKKVKSYLFTAGYHTMLDLLKKENRHAEFGISEEYSYKHEEQYTDIGELLGQALSRLPEIQRTVILLRDYEGYSYEEIGEVTGLKESQVKVYIYRGRLHLKNYLVRIENII